MKIKPFRYLRTPTGRKDALAGLLFLAPWILGTIFFFLRQFILVFVYAFSKEDFMDTGRYAFAGFENYKAVFTSDTSFIRSFFESVSGILLTSVFVLFFSMFVSLILNSKFHGRVLVRAIFFLPVIIATGPIIEIMNGDDIAKLLMSRTAGRDRRDVRRGDEQHFQSVLEIGHPDPAVYGGAPKCAAAFV